MPNVYYPLDPWQIRNGDREYRPVDFDHSGLKKTTVSKRCVCFGCISVFVSQEEGINLYIQEWKYIAMKQIIPNFSASPFGTVPFLKTNHTSSGGFNHTTRTDLNHKEMVGVEFKNITAFSREFLSFLCEQSRFSEFSIHQDAFRALVEEWQSCSSIKNAMSMKGDLLRQFCEETAGFALDKMEKDASKLYEDLHCCVYCGLLKCPKHISPINSKGMSKCIPSCNGPRDRDSATSLFKRRVFSPRLLNILYKD